MKDELFPFFSTGAPGLEDLVVAELATWGIKAHREEGGAFWKGTWRDLFRANLGHRAASRVLLRIRSFQTTTFFDLEAALKSVPWERWIRADQPFKVRATSRKSKLYHEGALEDRFNTWVTQATGAHPYSAEVFDDETDIPAQLIIVRLFHDRCTVSIDTSGDLLHRRGYRQALAKAPLRETLAWALLQFSGWSPAQGDLHDPFCGSGTIPIEAALFARNIPPGMANSALTARPYAFQRWSDFDLEHWEKTLTYLRKKILPQSPVKITGSDRDQGAIQASQSNAERAGVASDIDFQCKTFSAVNFPSGCSLVTNPPYGIRVSEDQDLRNLFATLGRLARERKDLRITWLCNEALWMKATHFNWSRQAEFSNGGIGVKVLRSF